MKIGLNKHNPPVIVPVAQLKPGNIGRAIVDGVDEPDYLYVIRSESNRLIRVWPKSGSIEPLLSDAPADWKVEIMPVGSSLTFTVE